MKKIYIPLLVLILGGFLFFLISYNGRDNDVSKIINNKSNINTSFKEKEAEQIIEKIYLALISKKPETYVTYIQNESLEHLSSNREEIRKSVEDYLKDTTIKDYKIISIEDFDENTKLVNTEYTEVNKDGDSLSHEDMIILQKNVLDSTINILYNGAISSHSFPKLEIPQGAYNFSLEKTIELIDGIGVTIYFENKANYKVSIGYGTLFGNITLTTDDGETYNLPFDEVAIYEPNKNDKISSFTFETTDKISKVEIHGIFELNEDGTPKEGSPKSLVIYEKAN